MNVLLAKLNNKFNFDLFYAVFIFEYLCHAYLLFSMGNFILL